jgi:hypothetical protein
MSFRVRGSLVAGLFALLCSLTACGGLQSKPAAPPQGLVPAPALPTPPAPAPATANASATAKANATADANVTDAGATEATAIPPDSSHDHASPCQCMAAEPMHKPKRKPKRARKHAPAPVAPPVVAATQSRGVVNAEVRSTNVPVMSILGKRVESPTGEDMGRVVDVLADESGRVRVAIIDFGGFLGVGNRRIAVDWPLLRFDPNGHDPSLRLTLGMQELRSAPEYKDNVRPQILAEPPTSAVPAPAPAPEGKK